LRLLPTHDFISQRNYAHSWIPRRWRAPLLFFSNMLSLKFQVSLCDVRWMWRSNFIKKEIFLLFNEIFSDRKVVMLHLCNWYFFYSRLHCYHEWNFQRFSFSFFPFCFDDKKNSISHWILWISNKNTNKEVNKWEKVNFLKVIVANCCLTNHLCMEILCFVHSTPPDFLNVPNK
jgi:hypothetical protein